MLTDVGRVHKWHIFVRPASPSHRPCGSATKLTPIFHRHGHARTWRLDVRLWKERDAISVYRLLAITAGPARAFVPSGDPVSGPEAQKQEGYSWGLITSFPLTFPLKTSSLACCNAGRPPSTLVYFTSSTKPFERTSGRYSWYHQSLQLLYSSS